MSSVIRVHSSLPVVLDQIQKDAANKIKKLFSLDEVTIESTLASHILACQFSNKPLEFKVTKSGRNKGIIELI